jgi:hypothetical protein
MVTPIIPKLSTNGGTLYTFSSTSRDLTKVHSNSSNYSFKFSHFVCLNIPDIYTGYSTTKSYKSQISDSYKYIKDVTVYRNLDDENGTLNGITITVTLNSSTTVWNEDTSVEVLYERSTTKSTSPNPTELLTLTKMSNWVFDNSQSTAITLSDGEYLYLKVNVYKDGNRTLTDGYYTDVLTYDTTEVGNTNRGLYLESLGNYKIGTKDYNVALAEHFQNYILNFETVVLNQDDYDTSELRTPAERIFFNWLRKVGGIQFTSYTDGGTTKVYEDATNYTPYDGDDTNDDYIYRTVQYIGNIDTINQVQVNGDTYGEVYLYIPSEHGASNEVLFRKIVDKNYQNDIYGKNDEIIVGRSNLIDTDLPTDVGIEGIFDNENGNYYYGDEGYCIDFIDSDYSTGSITKMNSNSYINFEFNCVLIYYDMIDTSGEVSTYATNLYGVLFLDNVSGEEGEAHYIQRLPKLRNSTIEGGNSFALKLDLKVDTAPTTTLKRSKTIGTNGDENEINSESYYDENESKAFAMYQRALEQLQICINKFYTQQNEIYKLQDRVEELESMLYSMDSLTSLQNDVQVLTNRLDGNSIVDTDTIMVQIDDINDKLNDLIKGKYNNKLSLDHTLISGLNGITIKPVLDNSNNTILAIDNDIQKYAGISLLSGTTLHNNTLSVGLVKNSNLFVIDGTTVQSVTTTGTSATSNTTNDIAGQTDDITLNITVDEDDSDDTDGLPITWKLGQSFTISATSNNLLKNLNQNKNILIKTQDANGNSIDITTIKKGTLTATNKEIELVCVNEELSTDGNNFITITR